MTTPGDAMDDTAEAAPSSPTDATAGIGPPRAKAAAHELEPGANMGRYEIVGVLGAGGMGKVYRARDPDLNRDLAIKVLRRAPGSGSGGLEHRLLREAQAMAKLNHPNLATVYDVGTVDGEVFIAFEFIDGATLGAWAKGPHTFNERLAALMAAGRGLEAAHSAGVIHRDFKPDNVLVGRDGGVKVVDFGLARGIGEPTSAVAARSDALTVDLTLTGSILGTPAYMAPEQHKGAVADARADQFGFAVAAWEVLFGERPFRGQSIDALAIAICGGEITNPPAAALGHPAIELALRRALAIEPADRFADLGALLAALLAGVAPVAPPVSAAASLAGPAVRERSTRRQLIRLGLGAAAVVAIGGGAIELIGGESAPEEHPPTSAPPAPPAPPAIPSRGNPGSPSHPGTPAVLPAVAAGTDDGERHRIRTVITENIENVTECYENALGDDPTLAAGGVTIEFEIGPAGRVIGTRILSDDFGGKGNIATCVAAESLDWSFPAPAGGGSVKISYPFTFTPRTFEVTQVDATHFLISEETWEEWAHDPDPIFRGVKPVPSTKDGKQIGWKLYSIADDSLAYRLGFRNGDTLTHFNDISLGDMGAAVLSLVERDPDAPVVVRFLRRGVEGKFTYQVDRQE